MAILGCKLGSPVVPSPPSIRAMTANIVNPVFHQLLNNSLLTVQVPSSWKLAKVIPLFKNLSDFSQLSNFRPIFFCLQPPGCWIS